ncbi:MAG: hypothetical protein HQK51_06535 [Oligoflexia bacterium]|nr:hypothetical protein [Oligoflexia bacterium]
MKFFVTIIILSFSFSLMVSCSKNSTSAAPAAPSTLISPYSTTVRSSAPDLSTAALSNWATNWSPSASYGILKKVFNANSGTESIFGPVVTLDRMIENINSLNSSGALENGGTITYGTTDIIFEARTSISSASIPTFLGGGTNTNVSYLVSGASADNSIQIKVAYGDLAGDNETVIGRYKYATSEGVEYLNVYATRNNTTKDYSIKLAMIADKGTIGTISGNPANSDFLINFYITGNTNLKTFKFSHRTNAGTGQAIMAYGSIANDSDSIIIRATDEADSVAGGNDYTNISNATENNQGHYVILTKTQLMNATEPTGYPKAVAVNLAAEATSTNKAAITINESDCLEWLLTYPSSVASLDWTP